MTSSTVRVYTVDLDPPDAVVASLRRALTPEERDAPERVQVARAAARIVLGEMLGMDAGAVPISRRCEHCGHAAHGRPVVTGDAGVSFNVSHSGSLALVAVLDGDSRVGVDVEMVRPRRRLDALARRILDDDAHADWLQLPDQDLRLRAFLEAWTGKEAFLKARGVGITTPLRGVPSRPDGWSVTTIEPRDGFVGAVAADFPQLSVEVRALALEVMPNGETAS